MTPDRPHALRRLGRPALFALTIVAIYSIALGQGGSNIANTKHNLTSSGPGEVKTDLGGEVCVFCHTPHAASPAAPLWNRDDPGSYYQTYDSTTLKAAVGQPTGSSRLCLSCHDGTIALTQTYNGRNMPGGAVYISESDTGYIGTDLSDDHPISFHYTSALAMEQGELADPANLPSQLPLDHNNQLQCSTCHDPHDNSRGRFLRMSNAQSQMCRTCHEIDQWASSSHATSNATLGGASRDDWSNLPETATTVADAACESCHRPHSAGGRQRLLRHEAEEDNCFNCHDGSVAAADLASAFRKLSVHPVGQTTGVHDPTEDPTTMNAHVECADCHAPHRLSAAAGEEAPQMPASLVGASGLSSSGVALDEASREYEVCYKCHSQRNFAQALVTRHEGNDNIADEFSTANASYHPVEGVGQSNDVPSLKQDYKTTSILYCSDCHRGEPDSPAGPHGSQHRPLLKRNYSTTDNQAESPTAYAACYDCHNRNSILNDESFKHHNLHVSTERTPCSVCHDPHGVKRNTHLINFDRDVVTASAATGQGPTFTDLGNKRGSCTLKCHNAEHDDARY